MVKVLRLVRTSISLHSPVTYSSTINAFVLSVPTSWAWSIETNGTYSPPPAPSFSYESSGYDHTPSQIRKVYTSPFGGAKATSALSSSSRLMQQSTTSGYSYSDRSGDESAIESGPSFNESLQRFRSAAAHSDTEAAAATEAPMQHSSFKMTSSSSRQQTQNKTVTRSVEEQTMITRNSQKSYHIE